MIYPLTRLDSHFKFNHILYGLPFRNHLMFISLTTETFCVVKKAIMIIDFICNISLYLY